MDIRAYCKRAEWGALHTVAFCHAQPDWPENQQRIRVNGPPLPGREPAIRTVKKLAKAVLGQPPLAGLLFALVALLERTGLEGAALDRLPDPAGNPPAARLPEGLADAPRAADEHREYAVSRVLLPFAQDSDTSGFFPQLAAWHDRRRFHMMFGTLGPMDPALAGAWLD